MEDQKIIDLYWERAESAIAASDEKYGRFCHSIAYRILTSHEDSEECVSDTWLRAWNAIPPQRPGKLSAFLGAITRNLALNRFEERNTQRRGGGQVILALDELGDCIPAGDNTAQVIDDLALQALLNRFFTQLNKTDRVIFLRRYWYFCPVKDIARMGSLSVSRVKMSLHRSRTKLRTMLETEGYTL